MFPTHVLIEGQALSILHEPRTDFGPHGDALRLADDTGRPNVLTRLEISGRDRVVWLLWEDRGFDAFGLAYVRATDTLFVGAGRISATIHIESRRIVERNEPDVFWGHERVGTYVLELGELECILYDPAGCVIGHAPVDPPYEYEVEDDGIRFRSIVLGERYIRFPG